MRIARFWIVDHDLPLVQQAAGLANEVNIVDEFALAEAADHSHDRFTPDETIQSDDVIGTAGEEGCGHDFEIQETVMVAEHDVRRFDALQVTGDFGFVLPNVRKTERPGDRGQIACLRFDRLDKIVAWKISDFCIL